MQLAITPAYAGLFALFFVFLSVRVLQLRRTTRVSLGDGGDQMGMVTTIAAIVIGAVANMVAALAG